MADLVERLWNRIERTDGAEGCWLWHGAKSRGYGTLSVGRRCDPNRTRYAHRLVYEFLVGPCPAGLEPDHLCRNPGCVNPWHLEWVTHAENLRRARRPDWLTHCINGHPWNGANTYRNPNSGSRLCRACKRECRRRKRG